MLSRLFELKPTSYPKALVIESTPVTAVKGTPDWYEQTYANIHYLTDHMDQIKRAGERVYANLKRYIAVEAKTNTPWYLIGAIHSMESDCDFRAVLHNGERIIGTGRKTRLVPRGRGPFDSWESAAMDALALDGLVKPVGYKWSLGLCLEYAERYNGLGYLRHHPDQNSPYLWACSDKCYLHGKYTDDGSYSTQARTDGQVGVATLFKYFEDQKYLTFSSSVNP